MLTFDLKPCKKGMRIGGMFVVAAKRGCGKSAFIGRWSNGKIGDSKSFDVGSIPTRPANTQGK